VSADRVRQELGSEEANDNVVGGTVGHTKTDDLPRDRHREGLIRRGVSAGPAIARLTIKRKI
jgi:hypothetical protein